MLDGDGLERTVDPEDDGVKWLAEIRIHYPKVISYFLSLIGPNAKAIVLSGGGSALRWHRERTPLYRHRHSGWGRKLA